MSSESLHLSLYILPPYKNPRHKSPFFRREVKGAEPLQNSFPLMIRIHIHIMERGIKGVRSQILEGRFIIW